MRTLILIPVLALLSVPLLLWAYVRFAPSDPQRWHVDPAATPDPQSPNFARVRASAIRFAEPAPVIAERVHAQMLTLPRTQLLAGSMAEGHMTFITRSRRIGYPDYTSIRILPEPGGGSTLEILARSRFGHSDLGVNQMRVEQILAALSP